MNMNAETGRVPALRAAIAPRAAAPLTGLPAFVFKMLRLSRTPCRKYNVRLSSVVEFRCDSQKLALYATHDRISK
jgi:hypothetical protein